MLTALAERIDDRTETADVADLLEAAHDNLGKGDALVVHLAGVGEAATVVAAEWHRAKGD